MKSLKEFFWFCSGASPELLKRCPTENSKYTGIGATVLFTGIFAALAAGYALYTVFDDWVPAVIFGILWGAMIFNLDRYIVSSMKKEGNIWKEIRTAVPRIILAVLLAFVISKPLELKMFESEINGELILMEQALFKLQEDTIKARFVPSIQLLNTEIEQLKTEVSNKELVRNELREIAQQEADGTGGSMRRNLGPIYKVKKEDADRVDQELSSLKSVNDSLIIDKQEIFRCCKWPIPARLRGLDEINTMALPHALMHWVILLRKASRYTGPTFLSFCCLLPSKPPLSL